VASICQIGVARFSDGRLVEEWSSLIDPEDRFDSINVGIHGINEADVVGSPTFPGIAGVLGRIINKEICVCHTHFDRLSIGRASAKYGLEEFDPVWLDSARVVRRVWSEFSSSGYGLANVCSFLGYEFNHHDAIEDAKAAGHVILAAINESGVDVDGWLTRVNRPIGSANEGTGSAITRHGNPEGALYGEVMVFTGALQMPRREAANLASNTGCQVCSNVTKKTTMLVVGDMDVARLAGHEKSSKHRKAEQLISKGAAIRILRETDFKELVALPE